MLSGSAKISIEDIGLSTSWLALCEGSSSPLHSIAPELLLLRLRALNPLFSPPFDSVAISDQFPDDISPKPKFVLSRLGESGTPEVATVFHDSGSGQLRWERSRSIDSSEEAG